MADFIHGTKPEFGPQHDHEDSSKLCQRDCETCADRIFKIHMGFFQKEFRDNAVKQHGQELVCSDPECGLCHVEEVTCPGEGCQEKTGRVRTGVPGIEIFQVHPSNMPCRNMPGAAKRCCKMHVRCWLMCSMRCLQKSPFAQSYPADSQQEMEKLFEEKKFSIPRMGALLAVNHRVGEEIPEKRKKTACGFCYRLDAEKVCGQCKRVKYCDRRCQTAAWGTHKTQCKGDDAKKENKQQDEPKTEAAAAAAAAAPLKTAPSKLSAKDDDEDLDAIE